MALGLVVSGLVTVLAASMAFAQAPAAPGGGTGGPGGGGGGRGRFNIMENIKQQLAVTDDEWAVLQPKLQKVVDLSRETMMSRIGGMMGRRGNRGGGDNAAPAQTSQPTSDVTEKSQALRTALDNKDADPKDIAQKLAALRDARERAKAELVKAQGELKELLSARQEAQLVVMGVLD
jgi:Spy/CpxP family protein refolding chaperone